ncbi:MAG: hypothetical protein ACD_39C01666G0003 [uncultured bacterium]|nr:MAG: hypothetical protein ACD_39C01666G0003 [uncultured bacterium]
MNSRLEILKLWEWHLENSTEAVTAAQFSFCRLYNECAFEIPDWLKEAIPSVSQGSLMRWIKTVKREGISRLGGAHGNRKGSGIIDTTPGYKDFIESMIYDFPDCSAKHVYKGMLARYKTDIPSISTIERWMNRWKNQNKPLYANLRNPDQFRNQFMPAFGDASENITRLNQLWEMDSTPGDVMLVDGRHSIIGVIDVWGRLFRMLVTKTSKSEMIAALLRDTILKWGVPEAIKTDNGSDYTSKHIARTLGALGITQELCPPFQPQKKPHIERAFGTFTRDIVELLPGYIGHNVAEKKAIDERKSFADRLMKKGEIAEVNLTAAQLQEICDNWSSKIYMFEQHRELKMSPSAKVNSWRGEISRIENVRALDLLLAPAPNGDGMRSVTKKGISLDNLEYQAPELAAYIGERVAVRYDPLDVSKIVVYTSEMELVCEAICCGLIGIEGVTRAELAAKATEISKKRIAEGKARLKSVSRKSNTKNIANEILKHCADSNDKIICLPGNNTSHSTPALESAAEAVALRDAMEPKSFEELDMMTRAKPIAPEAERKLAQIVKLEMIREHTLDQEEAEKKARIARYEDLLAKNFQGITKEDDVWRKTWEETPEGRTHIRLKRLREQNAQLNQA